MKEWRLCLVDNQCQREELEVVYGSLGVRGWFQCPLKWGLITVIAFMSSIAVTDTARNNLQDITNNLEKRDIDGKWLIKREQNFSDGYQSQHSLWVVTTYMDTISVGMPTPPSPPTTSYEKIASLAKLNWWKFSPSTKYEPLVKFQYKLMKHILNTTKKYKQ